MHQQASEGSLPAQSPPHVSSGKDCSPPQQHAQHAQQAQQAQHAEQAQQAQYTQQAQGAQQAQHAQQAGVPLAAPGGIVITPEMISAVMAHLHSTGGANAASAQLSHERQRHWDNGDGLSMDAAARAAAGVANGGIGTLPSPSEARQV